MATTVGAIFRRARVAQQLSQADVAALTAGRPGAISRAMISLIERGHHLPGLEATVALSRALNVEPLKIFELVDLPSDGADHGGFDLQQLELRAQEAFWAGDHRKALGTYDAMLEVLEARTRADGEIQPLQAARIEIQRAASLRHCGALSAARAAAERAVALAEDEAEVQTRAYIVLASLLEQRGLRPLARDMAARAIETSVDQGPRLRGLAWIEMGVILEGWGRFDDARRAYVRAAGLVREAGDRRHEIRVEGNIGACMLGLGHPESARRRMRRAVELARRYGVKASEAFWLVELGKLELSAGRPVEADRCGAEALRIARSRAHVLTTFRAEWLRHRASASGELDSTEDRHRLAHLRRLYPTLKGHEGVAELLQFRDTILAGRPDPTRHGDSSR